MARDRNDTERQAAQGWQARESETDAQRKMMGGGSGG
jgi:hypothetical protein